MSSQHWGNGNVRLVHKTICFDNFISIASICCVLSVALRLQIEPYIKYGICRFSKLILNCNPEHGFLN